MIPHNRPCLGDGEARAATRAIASGYIARGPEARALENELCEWLGLPPGCAALVSSGTAALYLALHVTGAAGKTVALPAYACSALRNAVAMAGATTRLIDCAPDSPNVDAEALAASGCGFAIAAHMYGIPVDAAAATARMTLIDDAAQSIGARINGVPAGRTGRAGIFSFYATKLMTTGGIGGAVVSDDPALIGAVQDYLDFDCRRDEKTRFNFQLGDISAAIGRVQLTRLRGFLERRAEIFAAYAALGLPLLGADPVSGIEAVRYRAIVRTDRPRELIAHLESQGIGAIVPTEDWEIPPGAFANARRLAQTTVSLPLYPSLSDTELHAVIGALACAA